MKKNMYVEKVSFKNWKWPYLRINFNGDKEYACPHGIGHGGFHGCDGCCRHISFRKRKLK